MSEGRGPRAEARTVVLRGGRVIDPANGIDGVLDVVVEGGRIRPLNPHPPAPSPAAAGEGEQREVDARGCIVTPGFVDLHAHLREPGFEQKGTIASETLAAMRGGFTTVCAMPNTEPAPDSATVVESLLERIARDAMVKVLPIGCITRGRGGRELAELSELAAAGCVAFSDDGNPVADGRVMRNALELAGALDIPISEHSDDPAISAGGVMNEGVVSERLGLKGQPVAAEVAAISRNIALCEATGARLHIAHVSTARGLEAIAVAKARGLPITCEVTPSHLYLTENAVFGGGPVAAYDTNAKVNPPLRTEADCQALVAGLASGVIDCIATDHAPHALPDKLCEFDHAAPGISCFETALGTLLALVQRGELELATIIRALTVNPSRVFALDRRFPGLGTLSPGAPGDVVIFDPAARWTVDPGRFASKGRNTPLGGIELPGVVRAVIAGGVIAFELEAAYA